MLVVVLAVVCLYAPAAGAKSDKPPLEKITFIHYKNGFVKPIGPGGKADVGYAFLAKGAKWKVLPTTLAINPSNSSGVSEAVVVSAVNASMTEWDTHTGANLFAAGIIDYGADWDTDSTDGRNEVSFGDYVQAGVIGATNVWGYFSGPTAAREIVEFDVMLDTDFVWGDAVLNPSLMDIQNIATHEIGHGLGLGDLYSSSNTLQTMYGYSVNGEIIKRDLFDGDTLGIQKLYGI